MSTYRRQDEIYIQTAFGRVIDALARDYDRVLLSTPTFVNERKIYHDYILRAENIELVPQPAYETSLEALLEPAAIARAYSHILRRAKHIFIRGMPPYSGLLYLLARRYGCKPVHWIVGNPVTLLKAHRRSSLLKDVLSVGYAYQDRFFNKLGRWLTNGAFVCNGEELASIYSSPRTLTVVSSTITNDEFFYRDDTCTGTVIRILFIGFVRPEKGVEYLIDALPKLQCNRPWALTVVGPWDQFQDYKANLDVRIEGQSIGDRVNWEGYKSYGPEMWGYLRTHDIFVLPSLSEGTPRVLVEARANSLPIIATSVGGIPTSVTDGVDGILVPPKDSEAIAAAIDKMVVDGDLRRELIRSGLQSVRKWTIDCFVDTVRNELKWQP